jgi:hypothetical protein
VFALAQLADLGLTASAVRKRVASGRLHRVHRGVYALVPPELLSRDGRFMAAALACGPGAVLSHRSAATLHELRATERAGIDVTVPGRTTRSHPGIDLHRSRTLTAADTTSVNGIPCTTVPARCSTWPRLWAAARTSARWTRRRSSRSSTPGALEDQLERTRHGHAARTVRAVRNAHRVGTTATWSQIEEGFLALCRAAGLPAPEVQAWIAPEDGEPALRVDFLWRQSWLIIETDGHMYHAPAWRSRPTAAAISG